MMKLILASIGSFLLCSFLQGQVALMPFPTQQFFDLNGKPCAGCLVYTYASGTSTAQATFTDYTGLVQNTNPVVLDGSGYPSNSGSRVAIWLSPGVAYRVRLTLANFSQVYQLDGVIGSAPSSNVVGSPQAITTVPFSVTPTFTTTGQVQLFQMTLTANVTGSTLVMTGITAPSLVGFELIQDTVGNHTFAWPVNVIGGGTVNSGSNVENLQWFSWDGVDATAVAPMMVGGVIQSPTLNLPVVNGVQVSNTPGTYLTVTEVGSNLTNPNVLVKFSGTPSMAQSTLTTDTGGVVGVCVSGCVANGTALIQQSGTVTCSFDGATTANDYVQISSTVNGACHDAGSVPPLTGQIVGQVLSTNPGFGNYPLNLFSPGPKPFSLFGGTPVLSVGGAAGTGASASLGTNSQDRMGTITLNTGTGLSAPGSLVVSTFQRPFLSYGFCVISTGGNTGPPAVQVSTSTTLMAISATNSNPLTASSTYVWSYLCNGN